MFYFMKSFRRDTSRMGTLAASPFTLSLSSGMTLLTSVAAPVVEGIMLPGPDLCQSIKLVYLLKHL